MKIKKWEIAIAVGLIVTILCGFWLAGSQQALAAKLIRLHVIANSDDAEDQALKLKVRDRILEEAGLIIGQNDDLDEAEAKLEQSLGELQTVGQDEVNKNGYSYPVTVTLENTSFPTKYYNGFSLPAGEYSALRVVIGEGEGQNWWCVLFPPLCVAAASDDIAEAAEKAGLTSEEVSLITGDGTGYVIKFKSIEILDKLIAFFKGL